MVWGDYISLEYGKPVKDKESSDGAVPVYGTNGQIGTSHLPPLCNIPSFIVGRKGAYRGIHYSSAPFSVIDTAFYALPLTDKVNMKWAYYKFLTYDINRMDSGSAIPSTDRYELYKIPVDIPDLDVQGKIVAILDSINEKIGANIEINENLQQQAFALFERLLSHSDGNLCMLSEIAEINPKRQLAKGIVARCIDMAMLSTSVAFPSGWEMKPYNGGMRFSNGDTIIARITPCLENGKTAFIDFLDDSEVAFGSTEYIVLATKGIYPAEFFYCLARYPAFVDYAVKNMNGSSGRQRVSADTLGKYLLPRISEEEISMFRDRVTILFKSMRNNSLENMCLSALRDTLLPKLMSGEVNVSNIDL